MTRFEFAITAVLGACLTTGFAIIALLLRLRSGCEPAGELWVAGPSAAR